MNSIQTFLAAALLGSGGFIPAIGAPSEDPALKEARRIHERSILVDGHNDILSYMTDADYDLGESSVGLLHTDLARLKAGGVNALFFSVWIDPAKYAVHGGAARALTMIDAVYRGVASHPEDLILATTVADIRKAKRQGRVAALMGIEGGYAIENSLEALRGFHRLGVRYMTLTHTRSTDWAGAATNGPGTGLTGFGREVVIEMNRLGMLVDVSHVSDQTMNDVLDVAKAPVIASHSSARAICDVPRNIPDSLLRRIARNGGVVMVNFYNGFLDMNYAKAAAEKDPAGSGRDLKDPRERRAARIKWVASLPPVPLGRLAEHIDHIVSVAGIDHVGIGSDYDGVPSTPVGLEDVSCFPHLTAELLRRGYGAREIQKILGENFLRAFGEAERVAKRESQAAKNRRD